MLTTLERLNATLATLVQCLFPVIIALKSFGRGPFTVFATYAATAQAQHRKHLQLCGLQ